MNRLSRFLLATCGLLTIAFLAVGAWFYHSDTNDTVPAVMAVLGKRDILAGKDYRGIDVISAVEPVPDSSWFIVAKIDKVEAFARGHTRSALILLVIFGFITGLIATIGMIWQRNAKFRLQSLLRAEQALRKNEKQSGAILMSVRDGIIVVNPDGRIEIMNSTAEKLTGWTLAETAGKPFDEVFHIINSQTRARAENPVDRVIREGIVAGLANHTILVARAGSERQIADSAAPIFDDRQKITGVVLVFRDVTAEYKASQAVLEAANEWNRTFDSITDMVFIQDNDFTITKVNKAFAAAMKAKPEELIGRKCYELLHKRGAPWPECPFEKVKKDRQPHTEEVDDPNIGIPLLVNSSPIFNDNGAMIGSVHLAKDMTERNKARDELLLKNRQLQEAYENSNRLAVEAQAASVAKSRFVANVSHEIRTPLNGIVGVCELLLGTEMTGEQKEYAQIINSSADALLNIVNATLDFSKIEAGKLELERINFNLQKQQPEAVAPLEPRASLTGKKIMDYTVLAAITGIIPGVALRPAGAEPGRPKEPASVIFDIQSFSERLMNDKELISETTRIFLADAPRQIRELAQKIKSRDHEAAMRIAHTLKGSAANVSGQRLSDAAGQIENSCRSADWRKAETLAPRLDRQFELLEKAMREFQKRQEHP